MSAAVWLGYLIAAGVGAPARYLLDGFVQDRTSGEFPWGTFVVNMSGCLALGFLTGMGLDHGLSATTRTIIGTGGLGAFTTFSTFSFESVRLVEDGAFDLAVRKVGLSLVIGAAMAALGMALAAAI